MLCYNADTARAHVVHNANMHPGGIAIAHSIQGTGVVDQSGNRQSSAFTPLDTWSYVLEIKQY
jgi:hypothetical protein